MQIFALDPHGRSDKTDPALPPVHRASHRSRHRQNQLGRSPVNRLPKHLRLGVIRRWRILVKRAFGRVDAADSRLREFPQPTHSPTITPAPVSSILTPNQGMGPLRNLGRPNLLLRHLLVLRPLLRIRHRAHRPLPRPLHLLLAHQRFPNFHYPQTLEPRYHSHSNRPRNPVSRRRVLRPLPQRHQRGEARCPGAL